MCMVTLHINLQQPFWEVPLTAPMEQFNKSLISVRSSVEWIFGDSLPEPTTSQAAQQLICPLEVTVRDEVLSSSKQTPVNADRLSFYFKGYNNVISEYLIQGFFHNFSIRYFGSLFAIRSQNLTSARENLTQRDYPLMMVFLKS